MNTTQADAKCKAVTRDVIALCAFLKRRAPGLRNADRQRLVDFVMWYWFDARVGVIRENGRVVAAALARCVNDVAEADEPFFHNEDGKIVWVDDIVSVHRRGVNLLLEQVRQRFGPREAFAGRVFHRDGELRMLPFRVVERLTTGDFTHGLAFTSCATSGT